MDRPTPQTSGFTAFAYGWTLGQNPYQPGSPDHARWYNEWRDREEHQRNKDEALAQIGWFG